MRRLTILLALVSLIALGSCSGKESPSTGTGVALRRDGSRVTIAPESGKVTLVHFWATWCGPCVYELPSFVKFAKANEGPRLHWVAVANDPTFEEVDAHLRSSGIAMDTFLDPQGAVLRKYQIESIPTTIVFDTKGNEVARYVGMHDWEDPKQREAVLALAR
ncbi:MAG: TlpA disulfide reductase family protein [Thermoanaerobaculia bacterium]|jgi:thiol-disulfide isomerase/thioredoxin